MAAKKDSQPKKPKLFGALKGKIVFSHDYDQADQEIIDTFEESAKKAQPKYLYDLDNGPLPSRESLHDRWTRDGFLCSLYRFLIDYWAVLDYKNLNGFFLNTEDHAVVANT